LARQLAQLADARIILAGSFDAHEISVQELRNVIFEGGADNVVALGNALKLGAEAEVDEIFWIHGPQPIALTPVQSLNDELKKHPNAHLTSLQVAGGRNAILEQLTPGSEVEAIPMTQPVKETLAAAVERFRGDAPRWATTYEVSSAAPIDGSKESSFHLVRLWANEKIRETIRAGSTSDAVRLAQRYQLVTPVSGAVVLETAKQFEEAGLKAADLENSPTVPEPGTIALFAVGAAALFFRKRIHRAAMCRSEFRR
jgi:hypothetical protein